MNTALAIAAALAALAIIDAAFSGYRASLGHDGLVKHGASDRRGAAKGAVAGLIALVPAAASGAVILGAGLGQLASFEFAGRALLAVIAPYALIMSGALVAYWVLPWRQRFLASSALLGPFSLLRVPVVLAGLATVIFVSPAVAPMVVTGLAAGGILAVEPALTHRYREARVPRIGGPGAADNFRS